MPPNIDPASLAGKHFPITAHPQLVVLGAGPAGLAAALEAKQLGFDVMLIDEHPVSAGLIGLDIPYLFGERLDASVQNKPRMVERIITARPQLEQAAEVGIDLQIGVYAWGAFATGPTSRTLPHNLVGLADEQRSWLVGFDRIIIAAGARDLALAFPGWDAPGVIGAQAFAAATNLYQAFSGRRIVVLGAGTLGTLTAKNALAIGLEVTAIIDIRTQLPHDPPCEVFSGHTIRGVLSHAGQLQAIRVAPVADPNATRDLTCDTIVCALDLVPTVEAFDLLGCTITWRPDLGGFVPVTDLYGRSSVAGVYAAGDCAGITGAAIADETIAIASGQRAARAAAHDAGLPSPLPPEEVGADKAPGEGRDALRREWLQLHTTDDTLICRCEEVTHHDLLGVRPPRYLHYDETKFAHRDLRTLAGDGPINLDQIKRLTRGGMGVCQGRRCREQIQLLLAMQSNQPTGSVLMPSYRAPLRPLPLNVLAAHDEPAEMREQWPIWFGIPSQWLPQWEKVPDVIDPLDDRVGLRDIVK
jgi:NADPH-dependent 2,4-dienoyl-CoA reductase/sulfur reductase-like enzyme